MKKYDSIMKRVRAVEEKYGIKYASPDGRLFKGSKIIYTLIWAYTLVINLMFLAGMLLVHSGTDNMASVKNYIINAAVCTAVLIVGFVLMCTKIKLAGIITSIVPLPFMAVFFGAALKDDFGFMGFKLSYYWRHLAPAAVMLILLVIMLVVILRYTFKTNAQYKRIVDNLYATYHVGGDAADMTEEQWEEFLKNYDPRNNYNKQLASQMTEQAADGETQNSEEVSE